MNTGERLHALDAVRAFALLFGVLLHASDSFVGGAREVNLVPVQDVSPSQALGVLSYATHMFRMSLFFMMAGFFARLMIHRKGLGAFSLDRVQRILIPLIIGWLLLMPLIMMAWNWGYSGKLAYSPFDSWPPTARGFPWGHLWFLYYLLLIYVLLLGARGAVLATGAAGKLAGAADTGFNRIFESKWAGPVALMLPTCAGLLCADSSWSLIGGVVSPAFSLVPRAIPLFVYGSAFTAGWMLSRNRNLLEVWGNRWKAHIAAAMAISLANMMLVTVFYSGQHHLTDFAPLHLRILFAMSYGLASASWILGIIGFAVSHLSAPNPVVRYLAESSYWVYLVHYPIVLFLQDVMAEVPWHWTVKFPAICLVTIGVALLSYRYFVRYTFIGRALNGRVPSRVRPRLAEQVENSGLAR